MKLRLAEATMKFGGLVSTLASKRLSQWIRAASSKARTADPAVHSGDPQGIDAKQAARAAAAEQEEKERQLEEKSSKMKEENAPFSSGKLPFVPQTTLASTPVEPPTEPIFQQKRKSHTTTTSSLDVTCVGVDGSPPPKGTGGDGEDEMRSYYEDHKPSPLANVEFADTRKPITRATDGTADSAAYGGEPVVIGWREEQLDTAEEALERARRIWRENAMRGDPDSPQSRALLAMLGQLN